MVLSLDECHIGADVELVLVLAHQLEQHVFLLDESELVLLLEILIFSLVDAEARRPCLLNLAHPGLLLLLLFLHVVLLIFLLCEDGVQVVLLPDVLADV